MQKKQKRKIDYIGGEEEGEEEYMNSGEDGVDVSCDLRAKSEVGTSRGAELHLTQGSLARISTSTGLGLRSSAMFYENQKEERWFLFFFWLHHQ